MREQIAAHVAQWEATLKQLQAQRQQLQAQLADVDTSIQRHIGAITGAQELLSAVNTAAETPADQPEESC